MRIPAGKSVCKPKQAARIEQDPDLEDKVAELLIHAEEYGAVLLQIQAMQ